MRGDHTISSSVTRASDGTAPRARGPRRAQARSRCRCGNSPACAGTTSVEDGRIWPVREQPRVRGDHPIEATPAIASRGTAPRARGPRIAASLPPRPQGNSPACAGTTVRRRRSTHRRWEQPRVRGDHDAASIRHTWNLGTAPRARGPRPGQTGNSTAGGNSPACAGTTCAPWTGDQSSGEQPRVRGDHTTGMGVHDHGSGTAPRARGPLRLHLTHHRGRGNSPACAGTTR